MQFIRAHHLRHQELRHDEQSARLADKQGATYDFHDYKTAGIDRGKLEGWVKKAGWETLLNRAGTTFRKLPDKDKDGLPEQKAIAPMLAQPSIIKRPAPELSGGKLLVGSSRSRMKQSQSR